MEHSMGDSVQPATVDPPAARKAQSLGQRDSAAVGGTFDAEFDGTLDRTFGRTFGGRSDGTFGGSMPETSASLKPTRLSLCTVPGTDMPRVLCITAGGRSALS